MRGLIEIEKDTIAPDQYLLDRYTAFSTELLRLSLSGIVGVGFLVSNIRLVDIPWPLPASVTKLLSVAIIAFGLGAAFALVHRYVATDAFSCHIDLLRMALSAESEAAKLDERKRMRDNRLRWSARFLSTSAVALSFGAFAFALAIIALFSVNPSKPTVDVLF